MISVAVYDTKVYDRRYLEDAPESSKIAWHFFDFRLSAATAITAESSRAVCSFVNDSVDRPCLEALSRLGVKLIALRCAGYNHVDLNAAKSLGISVTRVPAYSPHAVAEHTIGLLLALNRKIHIAYHRVRDLNFALHGLVGFDLCGKTAGIIGTGKIGKVVAQILKGFDVNVLVYDPQQDQQWAGDHHVTYTDLPTLFEQSDVISLHVPLLPETHHMINARTLGMMKRGVLIINTSRGKVIETAALIKSLKEGYIGGVALDVYEEEEGVFFEDLSGQILLDDELSRLLTFPNVLITAHQGFLTHEALAEIARITTSNILNLVEGRPFLPETQLI